MVSKFKSLYYEITHKVYILTSSARNNKKTSLDFEIDWKYLIQPTTEQGDQPTT